MAQKSKVAILTVVYPQNCYCVDTKVHIRFKCRLHIEIKKCLAKSSSHTKQERRQSWS